MGTSYGASKFPSLFNSCILWAPLQHSAGVSGDYDEFPIIPSGVTITNNGTFTKDDLGNNKSVLKFDGSTNYVSLSQTTVFDIFNSDFTVSVWVKFITSTALGFISKYANDSNFMEIDYYNGNNSIGVYATASGVNAQYKCLFVPTIGVWYYITVQRSGSSCLIYINGVSQTVTVTQAFRNTTTISAPLRTGIWHSAIDWYFNGSLKDFMIFTRALSLAEIKLLMNRTNPVTGEGLIPGPYSYWRLTA